MSNARNLSNLLGTGTTISHSNMPSGSVVQVLQGYTKARQENVTWDTAATNTTLYNSSASGRTYVDTRTLTLTPKFSNSILVCTGQIGWSNGNSGSTGARGAIITLDDTTSIDVIDYPWYATASVDYSYAPETTVHGQFTLSSASQCLVRLRAYGYVESGSYTMRYRGHSLTVMEIKA